MECQTDFSLKDLNTFHVEAVAARYVRIDEKSEIVDVLGNGGPDCQRCLILGGGSNLLFVDDVAGTVLNPLLKGIEVIETSRRHIRLRAMAGENWDALVAYAVDNGWGGIENLSLIPGSVGASAVQNIGAYGMEVKEVIDSVEAISMDSGQHVVFSPKECGFGYRFSHFKGAWAGPFIITSVVFRLRRQPNYVLGYPGIRAAVEALGPINLATIRQAIVAIRRSKLPDPAELGNAGSFFKNPVVAGSTLKEMLAQHPDLPHYPQKGGRFKLPAGWMIERCGWKGKQVGKAAVHHQQALVLVNLGGATGREILDLSEQIKHSVQKMFAIELDREVLVVPGPSRAGSADRP